MPVIVWMHHVRKAGMCSSGAREFFIRHGLDWNNFLRNGIDADILDRMNDAMATQVTTIARNEYLNI